MGIQERPDPNRPWRHITVALVDRTRQPSLHVSNTPPVHRLPGRTPNWQLTVEDLDLPAPPDPHPVREFLQQTVHLPHTLSGGYPSAVPRELDEGLALLWGHAELTPIRVGLDRADEVPLSGGHMFSRSSSLSGRR